MNGGGIKQKRFLISQECIPSWDETDIKQIIKLVTCQVVTSAREKVKQGEGKGPVRLGGLF